MNRIFRKIFSFACMAAAISGTLVSCDNDNNLEFDEQTITLTLLPAGSFTAVAPIENPSDSDWKLFSGAGYMFVFDFKTNTCAIQVENLKVDNSTTPLSFTLTNLPQSTEKDVNVRGVDTYGPYAFEGPDSRTHLVKNIRLFCLRDANRHFDDENVAVPTFFLSFDLDDTQVKVVPYNEIYFGTTTSTNLSNTSNVESAKTAKYLVTFNMLKYNNGQYSFNPDNRTVDITILNPKFIPSMPDMIKQITFPGIPFTLDENGFTLESSALLPVINTRPFSDFPISDLSAEIVYEKSMNLEFDCLSTNPKVGSWNVKVDATPFVINN